jgi:hypothetical protein
MGAFFFTSKRSLRARFGEKIVLTSGVFQKPPGYTFSIEYGNLKKSSLDNNEQMIDNASDGQKPTRFMRVNKVQITLTMDETLLNQADDMTKRLGVSRLH